MQRRGQGLRRVHLAGDLDRLLHQRRRQALGVLPVELLGLGAEQRRASGARLGPDRLQRLVDQADQALVGLPGLAQHRDPDRGADQPVGVAEGPRRLRGPAEGLARSGDLRRARLGAPHRQRQAQAPPLVGLVLQLEHLEGALVQLGGLLVGELFHRLLAGALGVLDRLGRVAAGRGGEEVVGELAEAGWDRRRTAPPARAPSSGAASRAAPGSPPRRACRGPARARTRSARRRGR